MRYPGLRRGYSEKPDRLSRCLTKRYLLSKRRDSRRMSLLLSLRSHDTSYCALWPRQNWLPANYGRIKSSSMRNTYYYFLLSFFPSFSHISLPFTIFTIHIELVVSIRWYRNNQTTNMTILQSRITLKLKFNPFSLI